GLKSFERDLSVRISANPWPRFFRLELRVLNVHTRSQANPQIICHTVSSFFGGQLHDYLLSLILGIVEGLTEFLPVSSTAHLRLTEALLGKWTGNPGILDDGYWKMYSIVIQLGAILCLPIYFRKRILKFLGTFPNGAAGDRTFFTHPLTLVVLAFLVTAIPAWRLTKIIGKNLESLYVMGI